MKAHVWAAQLSLLPAQPVQLGSAQSQSAHVPITGLVFCAQAYTYDFQTAPGLPFSFYVLQMCTINSGCRKTHVEAEKASRMAFSEMSKRPRPMPNV